LQNLDGYVFTPLVQRRTVVLPPAPTITAQVALGVLLGGLGAPLATPLAAAALVIVKMLYLRDTPDQ
jgi:predicted PurR-regulated permease PerM